MLLFSAGFGGYYFASLGLANPPPLGGGRPFLKSGNDSVDVAIY